MKWKLSIKGDKGVVETLKSMRERVAAAAAQAVYVAGNAVMTDSKQRAPLDTGVLRASGYVTLPTEGMRPKVEVGFGGAAGAYALAQHEHTEYHHEVGEAKFLEKAFHAVDIRGIIRQIIANALGSKTKPTISQGSHRSTPE